MIGKKLAIPAAAAVVLSAAAGLGGPARAVHAKVSAASYSGTISITDWQVPDGTALGGAYTNSVVDKSLDGPLLATIVNYDDKGNFYSELATDVPSTSNGGIKTVSGNTVVTVHLKANQKWSDGSPITPADYVGSVLISYNPENNLASGLGYDQISSITFSGNDMVVTFKGPSGIAVTTLNSMVPVPIEYYQKKYHAPINTGLLPLTSFSDAKEIDPKTGAIPASVDKNSGLQKLVNANLQDGYDSPSDIFSGAYKIGTWDPAGGRYVLVPNTFYTALPPDASHPRPAKIQFVLVSTDTSALAQALNTDATYNQIDKAEDFQLNFVPAFAHTKYQVLKFAGLIFEHLELNTSRPGLNDVRVREALQYAIDRTLYLKALFPFADAATIDKASSSSIFPKTMPAYDSSIPQNLYNPTKARQLLAAAGYATSLSGSGKHLQLDFWTASSNAVRIRSSQLLQHIWAEFGITVRLHYAKTTGANGLFSPYQDGGVYARGNFDIAEFAWQISPDVYLSYSALLLGNQIPSATNPLASNYARINDPTVQSLLQQGRSTADAAQQKKIYDQLQQHMLQQADWINLFTRTDLVLYKGTIGNFKLNPTAAGHDWNAFQWYTKPAAS